MKKDECVYPDWEGGFIYDKHKFDKDGFCAICGASVFDMDDDIGTYKEEEAKADYKLIRDLLRMNHLI